MYRDGRAEDMLTIRVDHCWGGIDCLYLDLAAGIAQRGHSNSLAQRDLLDEVRLVEPGTRIFGSSVLYKEHLILQGRQNMSLS